MRDIAVKTNGTTNLDAGDWNANQAELENFVLDTDQTLDAAGGPDTLGLNMMGKAATGYASAGWAYTDSGAADAYVLSQANNLQAPTKYFDDMMVAFKPGNTNTGASTVNVESLGVKSIKLRTKDLNAGDILVNKTILIKYSTSLGYFEIVSGDQREHIIVNVKSPEYGALGDGATDDTGAIVAAGAAAISLGVKKVYFPSGTYIVSSTLSIPSTIILEGDGSASIIKLANASDVAILTLSSKTDIVLRNLALDGNGANQTNNAAVGIDIDASSRIVIDNLYITNCYSHAIYADNGSSKILVENSYIYTTGVRADNVSRGIYFFGCDKVEIANNFIDSVDGFGITIEQTPQSAVHGNTVSDSVNFDGIIVYDSDHVTVTGNNVINPQDTGIVFELCGYCACTGNTIKEAGVDGVALAGTTYSTVVGNTILNSSQNTNDTFDDIILKVSGATNSTNNIVKGNTIDATGANKSKYGIEERSGSDSNIIKDNQINGSVTATMLVTGSATRISSNIGYVSENKGKAVGIATGTTVAHGLSGTPDNVRVTAALGSPSTINVSALGAATFTINFGGGGNKDFFWHASLANSF